jgi:hypothetical protein
MLVYLLSLVCCARHDFMGQHNCEVNVKAFGGMVALLA